MKNIMWNDKNCIDKREPEEKNYQRCWGPAKFDPYCFFKQQIGAGNNKTDSLDEIGGIGKARR